MTPEGRIKNKVARMLAQFGDDVWRFMPVQSGYGATALDYLVCVGGKFIAIETKRDHKHKLTPRQEGACAAIEAAGGHVFVVYDGTTLETVKTWIKEEIDDAKRALQ